MKVGLYFGTFNPIHVGHLLIANYMAENTELKEVWFVVSPHNPHKEKKTLLKGHHRLEMVRLAIGGNSKLTESEVEFSLPQPSYTATTLAYLKEKHPSYSFSLLMGEDNLRGFHKWYNYEEILANHKLYVYPRVITIQEQGKQKRSLETTPISNHKNVIFCEGAPIIKISSSFIRKEIADQKDVSSLLTEKVYKYLGEMNFYK